MISRLWRRGRNSKKDGYYDHDTNNTNNTNHVLPMNYNTKSRITTPATTKRQTMTRNPYHSPRSLPSSPTPTCTNFLLLGGQYYPGKDKQRQKKDRIKKLGVFVSCPLLLVTLYFTITGIYNTIYSPLNKSDNHNDNHNDNPSNPINKEMVLKVPSSLRSDNGIHLQSMESMKQDALLLETKWKQLLQKQQQEEDIIQHADTIAQIIQEEEEELQDMIHTIEEEKDDDNENDNTEFITNPSRDVNNNINDEKDTRNKQNDDTSVDLETNKNRRMMRTIHNMDLHGNLSSCGNDYDDIDDKYDITLVIQTTHDRLPLLTETCERWKGPMVVVIYYQKSSPKIHPSKQWSHSCPQSTFITYKEEKEENPYYPINTLRNIGLDHVRTSHVFVLDIDLIPSEDLYEIAKQYLPEQQQQQPNTALIVPAFERNIIESSCETFQECLLYLMKDVHFLPSNFLELQQCVHPKKQCSVFQSSINWEGHSTTRSMKWLQGDWYQRNLSDQDQHDSLEIDYDEPIKTLSCMDSLRYEPYMILPWCAKNKETSTTTTNPTILSPYYDERFHGYGKNKIQYFAHIRSRGYKFQILPKGFSVHMPHPESETKRTWNNVKKYDLHQQMDSLYVTFLRELQNKYSMNSQQILPMCQKT